MESWSVKSREKKRWHSSLLSILSSPLPPSPSLVEWGNLSFYLPAEFPSYFMVLNWVVLILEPALISGVWVSWGSWRRKRGKWSNGCWASNQLCLLQVSISPLRYFLSLVGPSSWYDPQEQVWQKILQDMEEVFIIDFVLRFGFMSDLHRTHREHREERIQTESKLVRMWLPDDKPSVMGTEATLPGWLIPPLRVICLSWTLAYHGDGS